MPFRDPETGKVFNTIREAVENYRCPGPCAECPLGQKVGGFNVCVNGKWFDDHPIEAARSMGYEVIDDKEVNMDRTVEEREGLGPSPTRETEVPVVDVGAGSKPARPRLAELLGVEEDEEWGIEGRAGKYRVHGGNREHWVIVPIGWYLCGNETELAYIINHPELIIRIPRLTEPEIERCRVYGAKWVSRDFYCDDGSVDLWREKPTYDNGMYVNTTGVIASVYDAELFPSVKPGACIGVEEAAHALKNPG